MNTTTLLEADHRRLATHLWAAAAKGNLLVLDDVTQATALGLPLKRYRAGLLALCELGGLTHERLSAGRPTTTARPRHIVIRTDAAVWQWAIAADLMDQLAADIATTKPGARMVQLRAALTDAVRAGTFAAIEAVSELALSNDGLDPERYTDEDAVADGAPLAAYLADSDDEGWTAEDAAI